MNPPYAEATSYGEKEKSGVAIQNKTYDKYREKLGKASNELFAQFFARIYFEIDGCILASFSTLKLLQGLNFNQFREFFLARYKQGFIIPAKSFDNVESMFPVGFLIWDTNVKQKMEILQCELFDERGNFLNVKNYYGNLPARINQWRKSFVEKENLLLGLIVGLPSDFQTNPMLAILSKQQKRYCLRITPNNLIQFCIYFSTRHAHPHTCFNHNDQFLFPSQDLENDLEFQNDCLTYTLFHSKTKITNNYAKNHWIPFTEQEVGAREKFESNFMTDFINGKLGEEKADDSLIPTKSFVPTEPLVFGEDAQLVFDAGRELWKYYHLSADEPEYNPNASFYDIKKYFQGTTINSAGKSRMKNKSNNPEYNKLLKNLNDALNQLAKQIQPKVYEYGFLRE